MHSLDYESQENSIVQKLLCKAMFTRLTMILMSLVILQVFAAYKRKRVFSITGHLETWFSESWKKKAAQLTCFMVVSIRVVQTCLTTAWRTH